MPINIIELVIMTIVSNWYAEKEAYSDPMVAELFYYRDVEENQAAFVEKAIYHLYMYHWDVLKELPFLVDVNTIEQIKKALGMKDHAWHDLNRMSIEDIAHSVRIQLSGRPIISFR